jgi:type IV secretory pathway TraG/TraD family ATPase VirD4
MPKDRVLDRTILQVSKVDAIRFRDIIEGGLFVSGGLGSGKTSTVLFQIAMACLLAGFGFLILTVKADETARFIEYVKKAGREKDLIIFNAKSGLSFDPLAYLWRSGGRAAAHIETIVEAFTILMGVGKNHEHSSEAQYFERAVEELLRAALVVLSNAGELISIISLHKLIASLPQGEGIVDTEEWQKSSECSRILEQVKTRYGSLSESSKSDLDVAIVHLLSKWASLDYRTRSNIESTWSGMASRFVYDPFRSLFCSGRFDFTPEQITHEGKILIVDMPALEYGRHTSRVCQVLIKLIFQRAWTRHQYKPGCCNGAILFQDEFPFLMHRDEQHFHTVCRSSAVAPICACQNILTMAAEEFGENTPGSRTLGFLGLFGTKVFMANNEMQTNEFASNQIGREWQFVEGWSAGEGQQSNSHLGVSGSKQLVHLIEPIEFTRLTKPDGDNPLAEGILHMNGRSLNATKTQSRPQGLPYLRVHFSR